MSLPDGLFQLLVRCPRCDGRNAVDLRRQGIARRARCGRCGEPLPRRLPGPLLLLLVTVLVVGAGLAHFGIEAVRDRRVDSRRAVVERLLREGRAEDAVDLLDAKRAPASEDGRLARGVARAIAAPVLAADADAGSGRAIVEDAFRRGDGLIVRHERSLPELLAILDEPLRRLQARLIAFDIVEEARLLASQDAPDVAQVERALQEAAMEALDRPPDVAAAVETLSHGIRSQSVLARARAVIGRRPDEARQILTRTAQRLPPPRSTGRLALPAPEDLASLPLLESKAAIQKAIAERDLTALERLVHARPEPDWNDEARVELDRDVQSACHALASLQLSAAAAEADPDARTRHLLAAMTCDEMLPRELIAATRVALAQTLGEAARRGGSLDDALLSWENVDSPRRDEDLAALGCLAEARGAHAAAVHAWSRVKGRSLALLSRCDDPEAHELPPPRIPSLDYPRGPLASTGAPAAPGSSGP